MYRIYWDFKGQKGMSLSLENKDLANSIWSELVKAGATNMRHETDRPQKHHVVQVVFDGGSRRYTYLTKTVVEVGSLVVVYTSDGRQVVKVVDSGLMTDTELAKICPLNRFRYIEGKIVAA